MTPPSARAPRLMVLAGALVVVTTLGAVFSPWLLAHAPLWLVGISPVGRHMVVVAAVTTLVPFMTVVFLRRFLDGLVTFSIGQAYGDDATRWFVERAPKLERTIMTMDRVVKKLGPLVLLVVPGVVSSLLVGSAGLSRRAYLGFASVGYLLSTYAIFRLGAAVAAWVTPLVEWVRIYVVELSLVVGMAYLLSWWWRRRAAKPELDTPR